MTSFESLGINSIRRDVRSESPGTPCSRGLQEENMEPFKIFIGGLSWQTTVEKLQEYFSQFGGVSDVMILKDPVTQRSRGFGFVTFEDAGSVEKALKAENPVLDGKKIDPKPATPRGMARRNDNGPQLQIRTEPKTKKIFVGGINQETTTEDVKQFFAQFGEVEEAVLLMDNTTKRHRGFGFVTMVSEAAVDRICEIHFHTINGKKVECKKALPKEAIPLPTVPTLAAAQQPGMAMLMARQRLAAQAAAMTGILPNSAYGHTGMPLPPQLTAPSILQDPTGNVLGAQAASYSQGVNMGQTPGKVLAYQGMSSNHRFAPYQMGPNHAAANQGGQSVNYMFSNYPVPAPIDMSAFEGIDWTALLAAGLPLNAA